MTLNGVISFILRFSPNLIALLANYITVVEDRPIMSAGYCIADPNFHFWPKLTRLTARSLCDSWATCMTATSHVNYLLLLRNNTYNFNRMKTSEHEWWQTQMQWQPVQWNAGAECSLIDQQCRCRLKTVIVQLLWVGAQLPTLYNTVRSTYLHARVRWHSRQSHHRCNHACTGMQATDRSFQVIVPMMLMLPRMCTNRKLL